MKKYFIYTITIIYFGIVLYVTVFGRGINIYPASRINLVLFKDYNDQLVQRAFSIRMLLLNMAMFIPSGILLPLCFKIFKNVFTCIITGFLTSLLIEVLQFFFKSGIFEADDLLCNTVGTFVGFLIFTLCAIIVKKARGRNKSGTNSKVS